MDGKQLAQLASDLVAIPSVNPLEGPVGGERGERRIAEFIASRLREADVECELRETVSGRPSVVARIAGESEEAVWFDAHTDTVSAHGMAFEPFAGRIEGDRLYGRGAADNKGCVAAMIAAVTRLARTRTKPPQTVIFTATADEEYRMSGILGLLDSGLRARAAVVGEPTSLRVIVAHKGFVRFRMATAGRAVHSSRAQDGINAIYRMSRVVALLEAYAEERLGGRSVPLIGEATLSATVIRGGEYANVVPDRCEVEVDRRLLPDEDGLEAMADVRAYVDNALQEDVGLEVADPHLSVPGLDLAADHPLPRAALAAVEAVTGESVLDGMLVATHAGQIAAAGIPAIVLGPGDIGEAHTATERLDLNSLEQSVAVYELLMRGAYA
jgi:acetylornithine deacetylase